MPGNWSVKIGSVLASCPADQYGYIRCSESLAIDVHVQFCVVVECRRQWSGERFCCQWSPGRFRVWFEGLVSSVTLFCYLCQTTTTFLTVLIHTFKILISVSVLLRNVCVTEKYNKKNSTDATTSTTTTTTAAAAATTTTTTIATATTTAHVLLSCHYLVLIFFFDH